MCEMHVLFWLRPYINRDTVRKEIHVSAGKHQKITRLKLRGT
jgi:hypothetical protein